MAVMKECRIARDLLNSQFELIQSKERRIALKSKIIELTSEKDCLEKRLSKATYKVEESSRALQIQAELETTELKLQKEAINDQNRDIVRDLTRIKVLLDIVRQEVQQMDEATMEAQVNALKHLCKQRGRMFNYSR